MMRSNGSRRSLFFGAVLLLAGLATLHGQFSGESNLVDALSPAVVKVLTPTGTGSGTILIRDGQPIFLTNLHVVDCLDCPVTLAVLEALDKPPVERLQVQMEFYGADYDFAIGRITSDLEGRPVSIRDLPDGSFALYAGDGADAVMVGMPMPRLQTAERASGRGARVGILGYPGLGEGDLIYTTGTVSSVRSADHSGSAVTVWYYTDTAIFPGNSGGLAFNDRGEFIGIPTAIRFDDRVTGLNLGHILSTDIVFRAIAAGEFTTEFVGGSGEPDWASPPTFGQVTLSAGFRPSPHRTEMVAGGDISIVGFCSGCSGYVSEAPDFDLYYENAGRLPLYIYARSSGDTTILVNAPDGSWHFNDDSDELDPMIVFENPQSGLYDIWVGTWGTDLENAELFIAETPPSPRSIGGGDDLTERSPSQVASIPDYRLQPTFGDATLSAGFGPDPLAVPLTAGGDIHSVALCSDCAGYVAEAPDFDLYFRNASDRPLYFYVISDADTTLLINGPDGRWYGNDDTDGLNPMILFRQPQNGLYDVWVGTYDGRLAPATLFISEEPPRWP